MKYMKGVQSHICSLRMFRHENYLLLPTVGDVKQSLDLIKYHAMRAYGGVEIYSSATPF